MRDSFAICVEVEKETHRLEIRRSAHEEAIPASVVAVHAV